MNITYQHMVILRISEIAAVFDKNIKDSNKINHRHQGNLKR